MRGTLTTTKLARRLRLSVAGVWAAARRADPRIVPVDPGGPHAQALWAATDLPRFRARRGRGRPKKG